MNSPSRPASTRLMLYILHEVVKHLKHYITQRLDCINLVRVVPTKCPSKHKFQDMPLAVEPAPRSIKVYSN